MASAGGSRPARHGSCEIVFDEQLKGKHHRHDGSEAALHPALIRCLCHGLRSSVLILLSYRVAIGIFRSQMSV